MPAVNTVKIRQGTSTQWSSTNPVLASGEPGFDTTNNLLKIGDGVSTWTALTNTASYSLLDVDNIRLDANTISSTNSNSNITLLPNGTGDVNLDTDTVSIGDSTDIGPTATANLLLLRFDGNATDSSISARTVTAVGNATTSTVQKKLGTHSAIFDGNGDRFDVPSSADFNLGATDFTVDFWMWINSSTIGQNERLVVFEGTTQTRGILISDTNKTAIGLNLFGSGWTILSGNNVISNQTWIHVALVRSGTTTTLYINGSSVGSTTSQPLPTTNSSVSIGGNTVRFAASNFNGYIDEVRIVNAAVWTGNFTPPTSQYSQYLSPNSTLTTTGTTNLVLNTNAGTNSGSITIAQGANANITLAPNGTGVVRANQLSVTNSSGDEGGQIDLAKSVTNTTITTGVSIDVYQNRLRFFETGGTNRGYYLDITEGAASVGSAIKTKSFAIFTARDNQPPASLFATLDTRNSILVLDFDDGAGTSPLNSNENAVFVGVIPDNANLASGLSVRINWMATSATTGNCRWGVQFEKMNTDEDADSFDTATEAHSATNGTAGIPTVTTLTCTTIDSLAAGDFFRMRVYRDASDTTNDTMSGDAELISVEVRTVV